MLRSRSARVWVILLLAHTAGSPIRRAPLSATRRGDGTLPWSVRNYQVFGELVPIRMGFGLILMSGNPILGQTIAPDKGGCPGFERPVFVARSAWAC